MKRLCNKLNKIISEKKEGFVDELNKLIEKNVFAKNGELMWDRAIAIDCNCNGIEMRRLVIETDLTMFVPSDDPVEHPGIKVTYKKNKIRTIEDLRKLLSEVQEMAKEEKAKAENDNEEYYFAGFLDCIDSIFKRL